MSKWTDFDILSNCLRRSKEIVHSKFYSAQPSWVVEAVFTHLTVNLKDALSILSGRNERVAFKDDIDFGEDFTDVVFKMRNALCHSPSSNFETGPGGNIGFMFLPPERQGPCIKVDGITLGNFKTGDVVFIVGKRQLYLNAHLVRGVDQAIGSAKKLAQHDGIWPPLKL